MNKLLPQRKSPRLKDFDYASPNYYFITICTHNKKCIFGGPEQLNKNGLLAKEGLLQIPKHFANVTVHKYVVMPNHVHIILIVEENSSNISAIIGAYKAFVSKKIHERNSIETIWQRSFHDHIIRTQESYEKIWLYIEHNPLKWKEDCFYTEE